MALLIDGVPIGGVGAHGRHGSATVVNICSVSPLTHRLRSRFVTHVIQPEDHKAAQISANVFSSLERPPFKITRKVLRARLSCIGGDGAVVKGGPDRKKKGSGSGEYMWFQLFPLQMGDDVCEVGCSWG